MRSAKEKRDAALLKFLPHHTQSNYPRGCWQGTSCTALCLCIPLSDPRERASMALSPPWGQHPQNPGNRKKRGCWDQNLPFCHHQHERPWQGLGPQRVCLPNLRIQSSQRTRLASGLNFCLSTSTGQDGVPCAGTGDGRTSLWNGLAVAA